MKKYEIDDQDGQNLVIATPHEPSAIFPQVPGSLVVIALIINVY